MPDQQEWVNLCKNHFGSKVEAIDDKGDIVTLEIAVSHLLEVCASLKNETFFKFELLVDLCAVDYLEYGISDWRTEKTTESGFSRGSIKKEDRVRTNWSKPRFAVVYHLLSITHNRRLRLKVYADGDPPTVPSVMHLWSSSDWYEREAFDLFGVLFEGHPDLRRLLTDYGFTAHPFRKDFPLIGELELRYDASQERCVYEPVSIQPRVLVPKVIRSDSRYKKGEEKNG